MTIELITDMPKIYLDGCVFTDPVSEINQHHCDNIRKIYYNSLNLPDEHIHDFEKKYHIKKLGMETMCPFDDIKNDIDAFSRMIDNNQHDIEKQKMLNGSPN